MHPHTQITIFCQLKDKAYLSSELTIKSKSSTQSSFTDGLRTVNFITQHQHWYIDYGLIC